jgi:hypothetical protein
VRPEGFGKLKRFNDLIDSRTHGVLAFSIITMLLHALMSHGVLDHYQLSEKHVTSVSRAED